MAKQLVFCADGTWNGPGEDAPGDRTGAPTNVFKLFSLLEGTDTPDSLRLADEQERVARDATGQVAQWAKYLHGVGDSENPLVKFLGGPSGRGSSPASCGATPSCRAPTPRGTACSSSASAAAPTRPGPWPD